MADGRSRRSQIASALLAAALGACLLPLLVPGSALAAQDLDFHTPAVRLAGADRFATSVAVAREAFPGWADVAHVVVASGDRGTPDALAAAGLCWAYDAPLLLVSTDRIPGSVATSLREIASHNPTVTVHVVGGGVPVPSTRVREIEEIVGHGRVTRTSGADRYRTAQAVAYRMRDICASTGSTMPAVALLADGSRDAHAVDALVFSSVTAGTGMPLLLLADDAIPAATTYALDELGLTERFVAGGSVAVSDEVVARLGATRLAGPDRYATAAAIAAEAIDRGWVGSGAFGLAAAIPDALSGASLMGRRAGVMLLTDSLNIPKATARLAGGLPIDSEPHVFGGTAVLQEAIVRQLAGEPGVAVLTSLPTGTDACGPRIPLRITTGVNTSRVEVYQDGVLVRDVQAGSFASIDLGDLKASQGSNTVRIATRNEDGDVTQATHRRRHLGPTWSDYVVVDKSDYRLYLVRDGALVVWYPIAHGRNNRTPVGTWRIDAKYHTDPSSVYGPRKMRLFRQIAPGRFSFTPYAIHGTNEPWVIGTQASAGCIRLYNSDVLELFPKVPLGTMAVTRE